MSYQLICSDIDVTLLNKDEVLAEIINKCTSTSIHLSLYYADEWYVPSMDYWAKREENNT